MSQKPSNHSNKIRNKILNTFLLGLLLIFGFGVLIFYLSASTAQIVSNNQGLTAGDQQVVQHNLHLIVRLSFLFLSLGSVVFMGLMFNIMFSITPALRRIMYAVQEIGKGNLNYRLKLPLHNELGDIANTLNFALDRVVASESALRKEKTAVEHQVLERTQQLQFEKAKFLASINGLPLGFMLVDSDRRVAMINPVMGRLLSLHGESDKEFANTVESAGSLLRRLIDQSQEMLKGGVATSSDITTGDNRFLRALYSPLTTANDAGYVVIVVEDVTEARIVERSKQEFFSIASHELRTPLTAIRGNAELIKDFYKDMLDDKRFSDIIESIHNSSIRLIGIVNDFLDASRLEQGSIQLKSSEIRIEDVVKTVIDEIQSVAKEKQVYVKANFDKLAETPAVLADPERVEQILYNMIGNALKFVEVGGVSVRAKAHEGFLKVYITDTGRGISPENQQLLFRKFQQANKGVTVRDSVPGTGLGLYISKLLAEAMGGSVALESSETDIGSTFSFTLPLAGQENPGVEGDELAS